MLPKIERDAMHPDRKLPPYSGALLGALVKAFDLDDDDVVGREPVVGGRYTVSYVLRKETTKDYFQGQRPIKTTTEDEIIEAVCWGLVQAGVAPRVELPPQAESGGVDSQKLVWLGLRHLLWSWDEVRGGVASLSASVMDARASGLPFLRLFSIDIAARLMAFLSLARVELKKPPALHWAKANGRGWLLSRWLERAGSNAPTISDLAAQLTGFVEGVKGASTQAVGYWRDGLRTPSAQHMTELAAVFSKHIKDAPKPELLGDIRRFYGLWRLCELLAEHVGWESVEDAARHISRYVYDGQTWIKQVMGADSAFAKRTFVLAYAMGTWNSSGEHGNASFTGYLTGRDAVPGVWTQGETDPVWQTDLLVCGATSKLVSGHHHEPYPHATAGQWEAFVRRVQHSYQRTAGWEALTKAVPQVANAQLPPPFDRDSIEKLMYSDYRLWPEKLRGPWEALSRSNPFLLANHYEQLASDEQMWGFDREAVELWKLAVQHAPKDSYKLFRLGSLYGELGQLENAAEHLKLAVDLSPTWPQPAIELARVLLNLGQHQRALAHLSRLPREELKQHVYGLFVLGHALAANGHFGEASWAFRRLTKIQPDNAGAYADASLCLLDALKQNPTASDRKEAIRLGRELWKEAHLRGDSRAKAAWETDGKNL